MADRLFVAIWPDEAARTALRAIVAEARTAHPELRWQPEERWHLTLAFVGQGDPQWARDRMDTLTLPSAGPLRLTGAGAFGPVLWIGVEHGPWLTALARQVQRRLKVADRRFRAHVTVGRARGRPSQASADARAAVPLLTSHHGPQWTPEALTLVSSRTGPHPEYHVLERWRLPAPTDTGPEDGGAAG